MNSTGFKRGSTAPGKRTGEAPGSVIAGTDQISIGRGLPLGRKKASANKSVWLEFTKCPETTANAPASCTEPVEENSVNVSGAKGTRSGPPDKSVSAPLRVPAM